jgi:hypothetical protein
MAQTPESKVKRKVTEMLRACNVWYFFPANNGFGKGGIPDIVACIDGRFLGIECKANATLKPTALQLSCKAEIERAGGKWFLVRDDASLAELTAYITNKLW